jgi:arabinose-5-phosphate isomerase
LNILLPSLKRLGIPLIALTGRTESTLARHSDVVIDVGVPREACPLGLAPTASTTAALAMGDALAVALLTQRGFKASDFRRYHPGGNLGARLSLAISEVMLKGGRVPQVSRQQSLTEALHEIDQKGFGATLVVDEKGGLQGIFTDGDLRRLLERAIDVRSVKLADVMTRDPLTIAPDVLAAEAAQLMDQRKKNQLLVVDGSGALVGALHMHDLMAAKVI